MLPMRFSLLPAFLLYSEIAHAHSDAFLEGQMSGLFAQVHGGSPFAFAMAMLLAFAYGVLHALGPGHGKIIVVSYFASEGAKYMRGVLMGFQIAMFHVLSSIAIVLIAWTFAGVAFSVGEGERAVKLASYGIIIVLGLFMLARHSKGCACTFCSRRHEAVDSGGGMQWLLALGIGIIPCPGILVFLFYAMANGMLGTGIVLALFMALGIALALCALGVAGIFAHKKLVSSAKKSSNLPVILRTSTSVAITVIGVTLFVGALFD